MRPTFTTTLSHVIVGHVSFQLSLSLTGNNNSANSKVERLSTTKKAFFHNQPILSTAGMLSMPEFAKLCI